MTGFTYAPVPPEAQLTHVDWLLLDCCDVTESEHIRVHELMEEDLKGERLVAALHGYQNANAKAVVLISMDNTLRLPEDVREKIKGLAGYPVVLITRSDGDQLLEYLNVRYKDEDLHAQLVVESVEALQEDDVVTLDAISGIPSGKPEFIKDKGELW